MNLALTRKIALLMKQDLEPWPEMNISLFVEQEKRFLSAIGLAPESESISLWDVSVALDEWTTTTDFARLSIMQRAVCGCGLLEWFAEDPKLDRVSPSMVSVFECLAPALDRLGTAQIRLLREAFLALRRQRDAVSLQGYEVAMIDVAAYVISQRLHEPPDAGVNLGDAFEIVLAEFSSYSADRTKLLRYANMVGLRPQRE